MIPTYQGCGISTYGRCLSSWCSSQFFKPLRCIWNIKFILGQRPNTFQGELLTFTHIVGCAYCTSCPVLYVQSGNVKWHLRFLLKSLISMCFFVCLIKNCVYLNAFTAVYRPMAQYQQTCWSSYIHTEPLTSSERGNSREFLLLIHTLYLIHRHAYIQGPSLFTVGRYVRNKWRLLESCVSQWYVTSNWLQISPNLITIYT